MKKAIYIFSDGEIKRKADTIYFESEKGKKYVPVENTQELFIFGEISVNKKLLEFLTQKEITVHFFNYFGYYIGTYYPREHYNSGHLILKQAEHYLDFAKRIFLAKQFVYGAVENMKKVISYYINRGISLGDILNVINNLQSSLQTQQDIAQLMAIEGNIREQYYKSFDKILKKEKFSFDSRSRRPPENRLNALINFGNTLLYTVCLSEIYKTHLDPRIGFLHATNFRRFSLNLDLAEIFKPIIVDRIIFTLINKEIIKVDDFYEEAEGMFLKETAKKLFVEEFDKKLTTTIRLSNLKRNVSYRSLIRIEAYKIEKHLLGEKQYEPFIARW